MPASRVESRNVTLVSCLAFCAFLAGCGGTSRSIGGNSPVTAQRLAGARLTDIGDDVSWTFTDSLVVIENKNQPIPSDLAETLLGGQSMCQRIEANWQLDEEISVLRLSSMKVDGKDAGKELAIPIMPAGYIRVNLGSRQYNVSPGEAKLP